MALVPDDTIQPQPVPFTYKIGRATMNDGREFVALQFFTLTGTVTLFMENEFAVKFAESVKKNASNVIIATQVPNMNGVEDLMKKIKGGGSE